MDNKNNKKNNFIHSTASRISGWFSTCGKGVATDVSTTLVSELDVQKIEKEKENLIEFDDLSLIEVDLCFVLDCTGSMSEYITAAKNCILKVVNHVKRTNPNVKLWVGLCGYRDHCDGFDRLQIFNFTDSYSHFKSCLGRVKAFGGGDSPEDVLGGLNAAVKQMEWRHKTRIILHLGDCPPHGTRFTSGDDTYPNGDPNGLTAEGVLENMKSEEILYYFGKITNHTDTMVQVFRDIIGDFLIFDLENDGQNVEKLTAKLFEAVCSSITTSLTLTSNAKKSFQRKRIEKDVREPDWNTLPIKNGELWHYRFPKTLIDIKNSSYFNQENLIVQKISYKQAPKPFSSGAERYAYFALDVTRDSIEDIVIKECINHEKRSNSLGRSLETVEVSTIAYFLSTEFNLAASKVGITMKVNFLNSKVLRHAGSLTVRYYTIEPKLNDSKFKRFNVNSGTIKEYHSTLEAFAHFTYEKTEGYLVVYDLEGVELSDQFLLTDPAIQCSDRSRFGRTNLGERGIENFLVNHKCDDVCQKLGLSEIKCN